MNNHPKSDPAVRRKILVVDDHPLVRERLAEVINDEPDLLLCGEAESAAQALALVATTEPHLAVVDLSLKNSNGLELIKDIKVRYPKLPVLVVSMHDETVYAERALRAGAHGYITKQQASRNILEAIRKVLDGGIYLSEKSSQRILSQLTGRTPTQADSPIELLSDRELEVLQWIGRGLSSGQIADQLHLDAKTIETYRGRIKEKLQLKDGNELLQYALRWIQGDGLN